MVIAALKTLTWGTIAAAVFSALLLAYAGSSMSQMTGVPADALRERAASPVHAEGAGPRSGAAHEARHEATPAGGQAPR